MLAETKEDVEAWERAGHVGVDMESATLFSISSHFNVPAAALLYVSDNLVKEELVSDESFQLLKPNRTLIKKETYLVALQTLINF